MKIYEYKAFPNPYRVRVALAEKGLTDQVEFIQVDVPAGEHQQPAFLAKNPAAQVPLLELDDGTTIAECAAITEYLDHLTGETVLTGTTPRQRALIHMKQRQVEANLLDAAAAYFHVGTPGLGPNIETFHNEAWGQHQRRKAMATIQKLDESLGQQAYIARDAFTVADITVMAGLALAEFVGIPIPDNVHNLTAWRERVNARPSASA